MLALVLFITFGLVFGYFATLNTVVVSVNFGQYTLRSIPMYLLLLASFGLGVIFTSLFYFFKSIPDKRALSQAKKETVELTKHIHELELKNIRPDSDENSL